MEDLADPVIEEPTDVVIKLAATAISPLAGTPNANNSPVTSAPPISSPSAVTRGWLHSRIWPTGSEVPLPRGAFARSHSANLGSADRSSRVFDLMLPLADAAEGCRSMDECRAVVLLTHYSVSGNTTGAERWSQIPTCSGGLPGVFLFQGFVAFGLPNDDVFISSK